MKHEYFCRWALLLLAYCGTLASCAARSEGKTGKTAEAGDTQTVTAPQQGVTTEDAFPFPQIPEVMTDPEERRSYLLAHYWDEYNFADTALLHRSEVTEQGLVNYVALIASHPDEQEADAAVDAFCRLLAPSEEARQTLASLLEKYLYDPMSPLRNDALYVRFLDGLLAHVPAEDARRDRWTFLRGLAGRNNPGQTATDFTYYLPDGSRRTLMGTKAQQLLLFFYDPECENCHAILTEMKADAMLAEAVNSGRVTVLAVYTEGNPQVWKERLNEMPAGWVVGTDREVIKQKALYDLKAMPTLYLLDSAKRVLLKDAAFADICGEIAGSR